MTDSADNHNDGSETQENDPQPVNSSEAPAPSTPAPSTSAPSTSAHTTQAPPSTYAPPIPGVVPPAFGHASPSPAAQPSVGWAAHGQPAEGSQKSKTETLGKRGTRVGIVAALAVGALVGGVSGAGVAALTITANQSDQLPSSGAGSANITVNDANDATTVTAVAAAAGPSVVTISVADSASGSGGTGSGVILTEDGYVVTNTHVVTLDGASADPTVSVQTSDGHLYKATIVGTDPISDLAVIKIDGGNNFEPADFADSSKLNVGDTAVAIGAPLGLANTVTDGIVSALNRSITVASSAAPDTTQEETPDNGDGNGEQSPFDFWQFDDTPNDGQDQQQTTASSTISLSVIQTDAAINPGNSGGALLDSDGKVIGINVAIASAGSTGSSTAGSIGVGFAIPSNLAKRIANEIIDTGTGSHGLLGATVSDVTTDTATVVGASIESVTAGGAAEAGGLKKGDVVTSINGIPVTGKTDLTAQVRALAAGAEATLTYVRDGKTATTDVTLGSLG